MQIFLIAFAVTLGITLWGRNRFRKIYDQELQYVVNSGATGEQLARHILKARGIEDIEIVKGHGILSDFYDPGKRRITLAPQHFGGSTYSALGIAANQAGRAIQHFEGHRPLFWRNSAIRATVFLSLPIVVFAVLTLAVGLSKTVFPMLVGLWSLIAIGNLITIPTELDASERAKKQMSKFKPFKNLDERVGVERVMGGASTQYVDGFFTVLSWVARKVMPWMGRNSPEPEKD